MLNASRPMLSIVEKIPILVLNHAETPPCSERRRQPARRGRRHRDRVAGPCIGRPLLGSCPRHRRGSRPARRASRRTQGTRHVRHVVHPEVGCDCLRFVDGEGVLLEVLPQSHLPHPIKRSANRLLIDSSQYGTLSGTRRSNAAATRTDSSSSAGSSPGEFPRPLRRERSLRRRLSVIRPPPTA